MCFLWFRWKMTTTITTTTTLLSFVVTKEATIICDLLWTISKNNLMLAWISLAYTLFYRFYGIFSQTHTNSTNCNISPRPSCCKASAQQMKEHWPSALPHKTMQNMCSQTNVALPPTEKHSLAASQVLQMHENWWLPILTCWILWAGLQCRQATACYHVWTISEWWKLSTLILKQSQCFGP